jgi:hypothetical protein
MADEQHVLYGGRVVIEFKEKGHKYTVWVDGVKTKPPSVTTVTGVVDKSGPISGWAVKTTIAACRELIKPGESYSVRELDNIFEKARKRSYTIKKEAADVGTAVHKWLELYFRGLEPEMPPEDPYLSCVQAAMAWIKKHRVKILSNERPIYSIIHKISGRLDGIGLVDGKKSLIDFKTGNGIYPESWMQAAAYQFAYEEEVGDPIEQRVIIRLGKEDGRFYAAILPKEFWIHDFEGFMGALALYRRLSEIKKTEVEMSTNMDWLDEMENG